MKTNHLTLNLQNHLTRQPASLTIQENCEGKIYIEALNLNPVIIFEKDGVWYQFDSETLQIVPIK